ncbi:hypothetical protein MRX96_030865 [Rhipicephalus microplus]
MQSRRKTDTERKYREVWGILFGRADSLRAINPVGGRARCGRRRKRHRLVSSRNQRLPQSFTDALLRFQWFLRVYCQNGERAKRRSRYQSLAELKTTSDRR